MSLWQLANRDFYESHVWSTVVDGSGLPLRKYPTDLYVFEEIIRRTKPAVIVETGSFAGGSAAWFSRFAEVISVDVEHPQQALPGVTWVVGDSVARAPDVAALVGGRSCLVTLDSDHNAPHVLRELDAYAPLATEHLIVEDTAVDAYGLDDYPNGGPGAALQRWLPQHPEWAPDPECDRFMLGMNPGGWLRRRG